MGKIKPTPRAVEFLERHREVIEGSSGGRRFELTDEQKEVLDIIGQERKAGKKHSLTAIHKIMRTEMGVPVGVESFRKRVLEYLDIPQW